MRKPCKHPGCTSHVTHPCEGCGKQWLKVKTIRVRNLHKRSDAFPAEWDGDINDDIKFYAHYSHNCISVMENDNELISGYVYGQPSGEMDTETMIRIVSQFGYEFDV